MPRKGKAPSRELLANIFKGSHEMIKEFEKLYDTDQDEQEQIDALQAELDRVETGAGLETDGTYITPTDSNYINSSISLADAIDLLDEAIACKIISVTSTYSASSTIDQNLLCNATTASFTVTLPDPTLYFNSVLETSKKIAITKTDTSLNVITISPFASELIVGESSQTLELQGEVLNFITDGTNWWLEN